MMTQTRDSPEWYNVGPVAEKKVGNLSFEVWANGRFCIRAPNDDYFKSDTKSAESWLIEHGINNDEELAKAVDDDENGWELINNRWYELMVFEESDGRRQEISDGSDLDFADNQEGFEEWINNAIEDWID